MSGVNLESEVCIANREEAGSIPVKGDFPTAFPNRDEKNKNDLYNGLLTLLQVTVGKGVADLVLLPVEQYRRDGRVLRGLRKGTQSFLRAVTVETLHTSHRVASFVARTLDDIVAQPGSRASLRGLEYYDEQPTGVLDSLEHAYDALVKEVQVRLEHVASCSLLCV